jgi:FixJ family two-component response regulator
MDAYNFAPTVFVVEDDAAVRDSLSALLEAEGFSTHLFASAPEVLAASPRLKDGCLLLDICLGEFNGFDVFRKLKETGINIPVIFMTAHEEMAQKARTNGSDAFGVLEKPINDRELLDVVGRALAVSATSRSHSHRSKR